MIASRASPRRQWTRPKQVDRLGGDPVGAAQPLGDQQRLAGELDRAVEAAEHVGDPAHPVLDPAQRFAIVERLGQGEDLLEVAQVLLEVDRFWATLASLSTASICAREAFSEGGSERARSSASWKRARASIAA